jgi:hypothetical protein
MKQYHTNKILGFYVILFSFSCSSNLDFNQINDFKSEPVYIANLTYFDILAKQFIENGTQKNITFDAQNLMFSGFFFVKSKTS